MNTTGRNLSHSDGYERLLPMIPGDAPLFTRELAYDDDGEILKLASAFFAQAELDRHMKS